ncbi:M16 family metallopeptidase [Altererythrobacter litoralis]|uniref:Insulinase family protein n=1 Tax=Altererythrobacter litoralis TaxID=3113904 RepID=A0ABU7GDQ8_9SPHN|nr:insulinase family protein [Erythrobacteraceae bacterium 1XM1-14]
MTALFCAIGAFALLVSPLAAPLPLAAQEAPVAVPAPQAPPASLQSGDEVPWLYQGSDIPVDREWLFGEMKNGLRYAVRENGVPPGQVSIRIRIDAGSLHETDKEQGYAHLLEHMLFRESKYLGSGEAIPTWQRLGATLGHDTNAETTPTHTVYKIDLPAITPEGLEESFKLLSGMVREPVLSNANIAAEVPIVLAEMREQSGAGQRVSEQTLATLFAGQRLANRRPIGTEATLRATDQASLEAFHQRWYRPENTVIVVVGDVDPVQFARLIERYFGDWHGQGPAVPAPDFGDPLAPAGADGSNPIGEVAVAVEADMPRNMTYAVMRPWRQVQDTVVYNEGLMLDAVSQAIINRRLESRARSGGSYLYAEVQQDDISRSADATFVSFAPLDGDWQAALADVRGVIADALSHPPTQEEIDREVAQFDTTFASEVEQRKVLAGAKLADNIVRALDIRETVASPETALAIFRGMRARFNPANVFEHTRKLFEGDVVRGIYVTPQGDEASAAQLRLALARDADPDGASRLANRTISFDKLPPVGKPGEIVERKPLGLLDIEQVDFANGVKAIVWSNNDEPGRVSVKVRFGGGYRSFTDATAPYATLGEMALVSSGIGELDEDDLDRLVTGRKMAFDFEIGDAVFSFGAQTRSADVADQLYLFAAKLGMPRWDRNPVLRAKAAAEIGYASYATSPAGVLARDLEYLVRDKDARFATPDPAMMKGTTPEGFREFWEARMAEGPVEILVIGEFDREAVVETLRRTFGALPPRVPLSPEVAARVPAFPDADNGAPVVLKHRGDADQAAAVIAWPTGGGTARLRESRQLSILVDLFNNRLMDALRERLGASYAPAAISDWPTDLPGGGTIRALAQLRPKDVPVFFAEADRIAQDLVENPPSEDEIQRAAQPLGQLYNRAMTSNMFILLQLEGATSDPGRVELIRSLVADHSATRGEIMQLLARRYFGGRPGWRLAVIPEGQELARAANDNERTEAKHPQVPAISGR